jgi:hypothetical protein
MVQIRDQRCTNRHRDVFVYCNWYYCWINYSPWTVSNCCYSHDVKYTVLVSIIYSSSILCLSSCHIPVVFLSSCHSCGTLSYSLCLSNQTDQGDEREGFEREGYRWRDRKWGDWRGRMWIDFSLFKPSIINMNVHSATCSCSAELFKQWYTLADFLANWHFRGVFSVYQLFPRKDQRSCDGRGGGHYIS